jgi:hypothetical protein
MRRTGAGARQRSLLETIPLTPSARRGDARTRFAGMLLVTVTGLFLLVVLPVVLRGAPLRDDFDLCVSPRWNSGTERVLSELLAEQGAVRLPGRLVQVGLIAGFCGEVPFAMFIMIPLALTLGVALLLRGLLRDFGLQPPWPEVGAVVWLLQPLGTEAALWAVQLNVPLALCLVLAGLRAYRRGWLWWGTAASIVACGLIEQVIFALPLLAWLVSPSGARRRVLVVSGGVVVVVLAVYLRWPGQGGRTAVSLRDRLEAVIADPVWYVKFPAVGVGLQSVPAAVRWMFPLSLGVLAVGMALGVRAGPALLGSAAKRRTDKTAFRFASVAVVLALLVNVPLMTTVPHQHSPRTFTPTWLLLAALAAVVGSRIQWRRMSLVGGLAGLVAAAALLSIALSVSVRVRTADFTEASSHWLAKRVPDGGVAAICAVPRTAVIPAPNGDFALHELHYTWAAEAAVRYYTGRNVEIRRTGVYWPGPCPPYGVDVVVNFAELPHHFAEAKAATRRN